MCMCMCMCMCMSDGMRFAGHDGMSSHRRLRGVVMHGCSMCAFMRPYVHVSMCVPCGHMRPYVHVFGHVCMCPCVCVCCLTVLIPIHHHSRMPYPIDLFPEECRAQLTCHTERDVVEIHLQARATTTCNKCSQQQQQQQHTAYSIRHTAYITRQHMHTAAHTAHSIQHTTYSIHTAHSTQHTAHAAQHTASRLEVQPTPASTDLYFPIRCSLWCCHGCCVLLCEMSRVFCEPDDAKLEN